jgi:hypothetical protein
MKGFKSRGQGVGLRVKGEGFRLQVRLGSPSFFEIFIFYFEGGRGRYYHVRLLGVGRDTKNRWRSQTRAGEKMTQRAPTTRVRLDLRRGEPCRYCCRLATRPPG